MRLRLAFLAGLTLPCCIGLAYLGWACWAGLLLVGLNSLEVEQDSPGAEQDSSGLEQDSLGAEQNSPGVEQNSPGVEQNSPGLEQNSPGTEQDSPGTEQNSPGVEQDSSEVEAGLAWLAWACLAGLGFGWAELAFPGHHWLEDCLDSWAAPRSASPAFDRLETYGTLTSHVGHLGLSGEAS